jgi:hypothetical protein
MNRIPAHWLTIPAAAAVAAALTTTAPEPADADPAPEQTALSRDLDDRLRTAKLRVEYKEELIGRLVGGRLTLDEVTGEFLRLNREYPQALAVVRLYHRGSGDEEKTARNVLAYVRCRPLPADAKARVLARLEREFESRYGHPPGEE